MNISIETTTNLERRLTISVPSETFEEQITDRLANAAKQIRLPGFRNGKVPMKEVRRRFGPSVRAEVAGELMQSSFMEAITQEDFAPAGAPSLEVVKMDPGIDFEFTATFEVFPNVAVGDLTRIQVKRPEASITDADIDAMAEKLRDQRASWEPVERAAAEGDQVKVDFCGRKDGEVFPGGEGEGVEFQLGAGQMIEDFDANARGMSKGESKTFDATFPDDYQAEELKGQTVSFELTMQEVSARHIPVLDEEFYKEYGVEEGTEEAFRREVRSNMEREMETAINNTVKGQVLDELTKLHEVQLPDTLVAKEIEALKQKMMQQLQMYGSNQELPGFDDDLFRDEAEKRVTVGLVLNEITNEADIEADAEKVRERIESIAEPYAQPEQVVNYYYSNQEQLQQIQMAVIEDQVIDHILESATIDPIEASYETVVAGTAIPALDDDSDDDTDNDNTGDASEDSSSDSPDEQDKS